MSKLITVPIDFISIEDLTTQYQNNLEINFDNLGIIADQRTILSQILYTEYKLYRNPYKLMVNKNTYQSERKNIIQYIIEEIIITNRQKGNSDITINRKIQYILYRVEYIFDLEKKEQDLSNSFSEIKTKAEQTDKTFRHRGL